MEAEETVAPEGEKAARILQEELAAAMEVTEVNPGMAV